MGFNSVFKGLIGPKTPIQPNLSASHSFRVCLGAVKAGGSLLARGQMYSASTQEL